MVIVAHLSSVIRLGLTTSQVMDRETGAVYLSGHLYRPVYPDGSCCVMERDAASPCSLMLSAMEATGGHAGGSGGTYTTINTSDLGTRRDDSITWLGRCNITLTKMNTELIAR